MKYIASLVFAFLCVIYTFFGYKKTKDLLSPVCFFSIYFFLTRVPKMLITQDNSFTKTPITEAEILRYFYVTFIYFTAVATVMLYGKQINDSSHCISKQGTSLKKSNTVDYSHLLRVGIICFVIGAFSRAYMIISVGGIKYIWNNLIHRASMTYSMGYLDSLTLFLTFGIALVECCYIRKRDIELRILYYFMIVTASILLLAFGARSPLLKMLIAIFFVFYYKSECKSAVKILLRPKNIILVIALVLLMITLPSFRTSSFVFNAEKVMHGFQKSAKNLLSIVDSISVYDEDVFTFNYFSRNEKWFGKSYLDLIYAWIPRNLMPNKPPVDDGVYLRSLMMGFDVVPSVSFSKLPTNSSVPFSNNGIAYANFGILGSFLFGVIYALVINKQYRKMIKSDYSVEEIVIYQLFCTRLVFSVKGLVEFLMILILYCFFKVILKTRIVLKSVRYYS